MASPMDIWQALRAALTLALTGYVLPKNIYVDSPPPARLSDQSRDPEPMISIWDLGMSRDTTRWAPKILQRTAFVCNLVSTLSGDFLPTGDAVTVTLSGGLQTGDAVSFVAHEGLLTRASIVEAVDGDTLDLLAAKLAAKINTDQGVDDPWVHATVVGAVVTVTNVSPTIQPALYSRTGSGGTQLTQVGTQIRVNQISAFFETRESRDLVVPIILGLIGDLQAQGGGVYDQFLILADGTAMRLKSAGDKGLQGNRPNNIFQWNFLVECEIAITQRDRLWTILAAIPTKSVGFGAVL